jgi:hypothetical protein
MNQCEKTFFFRFQMLLRHCECYGILLDLLKLHSICNIVQEYSHELKEKQRLFDKVNIQIVDENENSKVEKITFPNGFYLHNSGHYLCMILRFDGYCLQKFPSDMSIIFEQDFPLLKTFSFKRRLTVYNAMMSNKRKRDYAEEVPETFHVLCNKIQASILQWYIDKNITTLFH